jgi:hypothetical protein
MLAAVGLVFGCSLEVDTLESYLSRQSLGHT